MAQKTSIEKTTSRWYSARLKMEILSVRWGHAGLPVLLFPTAGGDAEECERFKMLYVLAPLLEAGKIRVYSCDSVAGRVWTDGETSGGHRAWFQNQFDAYVYKELVPAIRNDCKDPAAEIVTAGASIGAFNALAAICRHPDVFRTAICMSGTYDFKRWMGGEHTDDFHHVSPLNFIPYLGEGDHLSRLRKRFIVLATGEGDYEAPAESWQVGQVLGAKGIPNRVDFWGKEYRHDWNTWRAMLPKYLGELTK